MKIKYETILGVIFLLVTAVFSGCVNSDNVSAAEIKMFTLDSSIQINSYRFLMNMDIETDIGGSEMKMTANANGAVNVLDQKMMMEMSSAIPGANDMELLYFVIGELIYMKMDYFGNEQWTKMNFSDYNVSWDTYDQMNMQIDLLDYGEVERLDDEIIDNTDCYVLKIIPDLDKLIEALMNQQGLGTGMVQDVSYSDMVEELSLKLWISKDDNLILKAYEYMLMEMSMFGYEYSMSFKIEIRFFDYNEPVIIELPEDAENSISYQDYLSGMYSSPPA